MIGRHRSSRDRRAALAVIVVTVGLGGPAAGQQPAATDLSIAPRWAADRFVGGRTTLELELSRPLTSSDERLAVLIGSLDVSALLEVRGTRVRYRPTAARLPSGETEVVAYRVDRAGGWSEVGRAPLRVLTRGGLERGGVIPNADLSSTGQLDQRLPEGAPSPDRRTYQDLTLNLGIQGQGLRGGWQLTTQANALGVTQEAQRLRWADMQSDAPAIDLSDYRLQLERGRARLTMGNVATGANRFLLSGFGSRGLSAAVGIGSVATVDASLVNGTNVVGWTNLLGLSRSAHRIGTASLSLELKPSRPGAIHVDFSGLDASVLPLTSFNQGAATDAEESRGFGVQVAMSDARQRIRFSGGMSRSRFMNPADSAPRGRYQRGRRAPDQSDRALWRARPATRSGARRHQGDAGEPGRVVPPRAGGPALPECRRVRPIGRGEQRARRDGIPRGAVVAGRALANP